MKSNSLLHFYENLLLENKPELSGLIDERIENNRKGCFKIKISSNSAVQSISVHLKQHDFKFGCNTFMLKSFESEEQNSAYEEKFTKLFNLGVAGTFWKEYEPQKGVYRFDKNSPYVYRRPPVDTVVDFCRKNDISIKGHNLIWHQSSMQPDWLNPDRTKIMPDIEDYIEAVGKRYDGVFDYVDVSNENLCRGIWSHYDPNVGIMPEDFVFKAFKKADKVFKKTKLMTNENHMGAYLNFCDDSSWYYMYLKALKGDGCRVDGIGMQYHLFLSKKHEEWFGLDIVNLSVLDSIISLYERFETPIHISEITIPTSILGSPVDEGLQRDATESLFRMWFSHEYMDAIIWWNLIDGYCYANEDSYKGALLHKDFSEKPVYKMLDRLINKEWTTDQTLSASENGEYAFRGFYGIYEVTVKTDKGTLTKTCSFKKGGKTDVKIIL